MNPTLEFIKDYWSQIALMIGIIVSYYSGRQAKQDKHEYEKSRTFNLDIDSLSDSFDLSQKMLATVRTQLDDTQESLNKANQAYKILKIELHKAVDQIQACKTKSAALGVENKELIKRLQTCDFKCKNKVIFEKRVKNAI
jgi:septal ring factor EnvC (AmiA/AmiB activator)